jgi:hypothetical protein
MGVGCTHDCLNGSTNINTVTIITSVSSIRDLNYGDTQKLASLAQSDENLRGSKHHDRETIIWSYFAQHTVV